ncbi:MAG TPA: ATP-binding protein [Desulfobacter sp.]|nr:ATP-binding protein [Desulfobacter sp.]
MKKRYLQDQIKKDLKSKMVFVSGPRQVGKTTLAQSVFTDDVSYLNWDIPAHREAILKRELPLADLWCFDEIHKYSSWRDFLKGVYDEFQNTHQILVTGSARLDMLRKSGDSLQGRYHHLRLHPLSVKELGLSKQDEFLELLELGGFPEPYFSKSAVESKRWSLNYRSLLVNYESPSLESISDLSKLELLSLRLPELVGAPLSLNALRQDLQVAHKTIDRWTGVLENVYMLFRLSPFGSPLIRAVKKEQKHYHFDWSLVQDMSARFENLTASHLLKWVHYQRDVFGEPLELRYFRDTDKREVDFCITKNFEPQMFVECKWKDSATSSHLYYLKKKFPDAEYFQISATGKKRFENQKKIIHLPAINFLQKFV